MSDASKKMSTLFAESKQFGADAKDNASGIKNLASTMARKEIKFNIIEKISRIVYTNPNHLIKVEFVQYIMFIVLLYIYNPFDINTKYPVFFP